MEYLFDYIGVETDQGNAHYELSLRRGRITLSRFQVETGLSHAPQRLLDKLSRRVGGGA